MTPERRIYLKIKHYFDIRLKKKLGVFLIVFHFLMFQENYRHMGYALLILITALGGILIINGVRDEIIHAIRKDENKANE